MEQPSNPITKWVLLLIVIGVLGGVVAFMIEIRNPLDDLDKMEDTPIAQQDSLPAQEVPSVPVASVPAQQPPKTTTQTTAQTSAYKDGTYSADGSYDAPSGNEQIGVTLTLKDDVVTSVIIDNKAAGVSARWVDRFTSGINTVVVGKKLNEVNVGSVSGSSLTPIGFMEAVSKIKSQAKA